MGKAKDTKPSTKLTKQDIIDNDTGPLSTLTAKDFQDVADRLQAEEAYEGYMNLLGIALYDVDPGIDDLESLDGVQTILKIVEAEDLDIELALGPEGFIRKDHLTAVEDIVGALRAAKKNEMSDEAALAAVGSYDI